MKIAVIGQGYVGAAYADWLESNGHDVIRHDIKPPHQNGHLISEAEMVIVAVPTPTTLQGQDITAVREAVGRAKAGATVVIKSTVLPGTTDALQAERPEIRLLHSPEELYHQSQLPE